MVTGGPERTAVGLPRVTVITPAYNRAGFLDEAIRSVLEQEYPNLEYIVLDDGSTDETPAVIERYAGRLRTTRHENVGEAATVNRGFKLATGELLLVLSDDDVLLPGALHALAGALTAEPKTLAAYPDWEMIGERGEVLYHVRTMEYSYLDMVRLHHCLPGPGTIFRRSIVERIGGRDPSLRYVSDFEFWMRAGLLGPLRRVPTTLAAWRRHPANTTNHASGVASAREHLDIVDRLFAREDIPPEVAAAWTEAYRNAFYTAGIVCTDPVRRGRERFTVADSVLDPIFHPDREIDQATVAWLHGEVAQRDDLAARLGQARDRAQG